MVELQVSHREVNVDATVARQWGIWLTIVHSPVKLLHGCNPTPHSVYRTATVEAQALPPIDPGQLTDEQLNQILAEHKVRRERQELGGAGEQSINSTS